jgi:hypothetical protein
MLGYILVVLAAALRVSAADLSFGQYRETADEQRSIES